MKMNMTVEELRKFLANKPGDALVGIYVYSGDFEPFDEKPVWHGRSKKYGPHVEMPRIYLGEEPEW